MTRTALTTSLVALAALAVLVAPRLTPEPAAPLPVAHAPAPPPPPAPPAIPEAVIPEATAPVEPPTQIIPEATAPPPPPVRRHRAPKVELPPAPEVPWDCPPCGMG